MFYKKIIMKTILKTAIYVALFSLNFVAFAQFEILQDVGSGAPLRANPYPDVKGVPFIEDFSLGSIIYSKKDTLHNIQLRFNSFGNMLEFKKDGNVFGYSSKDIIGFVANVEGKPSVFKSGIDIPKVGKDVFVQVLVEGDFTVVNYRYKVLIDDPGAAYGSQRSKSFQNKNELYIVTPDRVMLFKPKKKQILEIFGNKADKVFEIESNLGLTLKEDRDLVKIVTVLNGAI
jgi:hypothetical protein